MLTQSASIIHRQRLSDFCSECALNLPSLQITLSYFFSHPFQRNVTWLKILTGEKGCDNVIASYLANKSRGINHPHGSHYYQKVISWLVWSNDSYIQRLCVLSNCKMMSKLHLDKKENFWQAMLFGQRQSIDFLTGILLWQQAAALCDGSNRPISKLTKKFSFSCYPPETPFPAPTSVRSWSRAIWNQKKKKKISLKCKQLSRSPQLSAFSGPLLEIPCTVYSQYCFQQPQAAVFNGKATLPAPNDRLTMLPTTWWMQWNIWQLKSWICP